MSDDNGRKKNPRDANLGRGAYENRGDPAIRERAGQDLPKSFNAQAEYADRLADLTPDARMEVQAAIRQGEASQQRLEKRHHSQRRFREIAAENKRYRELLTHPDLKLGEIPFDGRSEIKHIEELSKSDVARRESNEQKNLQDDIRFSIDGTIHDAQTRDDPSHAHETHDEHSS
ncbi:hypothetical protein [Roseibium album]|uniref:hypothetical protein n=1 Tax=Roseibium album TaxID=311410 RepID=UPI00329977E4